MTCVPWPIVWPCEKDRLPVSSAEQMAAAISGAQTILWSRTGRRLGVCTVTERYSVSPDDRTCEIPYDDLSARYGRSGAGSVINLVQQPVNQVVSVTVDGALIPAAGYYLQGSDLVRVGGRWPATVSGGAPRVLVVYSWGVPLVGVDVATRPALWGLAAAAMGEVALELLQGMCGGVCKLPSRTVTITRSGVTVNLGAPGEYADKGRLGLAMADQLIDSVNPGHRAQRSQVYSPDMAQRSR